MSFCCFENVSSCVTIHEFMYCLPYNTHHMLEFLTFSFACMQSLSVKKYFELEEDNMKVVLKDEELCEKQKKEVEGPKKKTVSFRE